MPVSELGKEKNRKFCFSLLLCTWLSSSPCAMAIRDRGRQWWRPAGLPSHRCHCWLWASHRLLWVYLIQINKLLSAHWNKLGFGIVKLHCRERDKDRHGESEGEREGNTFQQTRVDAEFSDASELLLSYVWRAHFSKAPHSLKLVAQSAAGWVSHWLSWKQQLCWCRQHSHTLLTPSIQTFYGSVLETLVEIIGRSVSRQPVSIKYLAKWK